MICHLNMLSNLVINFKTLHLFNCDLTLPMPFMKIMHDPIQSMFWIMENPAQHLAHDLLDTNETLDFVHLGNDDQLHDNTWNLTRMDATRFEPRWEEYATTTWEYATVTWMNWAAKRGNSTVSWRYLPVQMAIDSQKATRWRLRLPALLPPTPGVPIRVCRSL